VSKTDKLIEILLRHKAEAKILQRKKQTENTDFSEECTLRKYARRHRS